MSHYRPYPAYRETGVHALGKVPIHWDVRRVASLGALRKANGGTKQDNVDAGVPCVRYGDLYTAHDFAIRQTTTFVAEETAADYTALRFGDVLFAASGETFEDIGKSAVNLLPGKACCGGDVIVLRPSDGPDPLFLGYALDSSASRAQKAEMGKGFTVVHVYADQLRNLVVALPPPDEQTAIARAIERETARIDGLIAKKTEFIDLLAKKRQALITHAVTKGLNPKVKMRDSGVEWIGETPEHWQLRPIKSLADGRGTLFIDGDWIESHNLSEDGVRYITTGNVGEGVYKEQGAGFISDQTFVELNCTEVLPGDILISRLNPPIGRACLAPDLGMRVVTSVDNVVLRPSKAFDRTFLVFLFSSQKYLHEASNLARGATMQRISRSELGDIRIAVPPLEEQVQIGQYLNGRAVHIDALAAKVQSSVGLLTKRRSALITAAVTGQIDLRESA